jgi:hypothetical protein
MKADGCHRQVQSDKICLGKITSMKRNSNVASKIFREIAVWKQVNDSTLIRYRCLHILPDDKYCVKSSDFYYYPLEEGYFNQLERYYIESLFGDSLVGIEKVAFGTIEEAIAAHEESFKE